jgi:hypothetical protein
LGSAALSGSRAFIAESRRAADLQLHAGDYYLPTENAGVARTGTTQKICPA